MLFVKGRTGHVIETSGPYIIPHHGTGATSCEPGPQSYGTSPAVRAHSRRVWTRRPASTPQPGKVVIDRCRLADNYDENSIIISRNECSLSHRTCVWNGAVRSAGTSLLSSTHGGYPRLGHSTPCQHPQSPVAMVLADINTLADTGWANER